MIESPFPHQGPLAPDRLTGRASLLADLAERVSARRLTAVLGPRRYGKTSLLRRLSADLTAAGTNTVWVDLYGAQSMADVAIRFDDALAAVAGPPRTTLDRLSAAVELNLGLVKVALRRADRPDPDATLHLLLDLLVATAISHPTLLVLDEFSAIDGVNGAAALLRTKLQHHYQDLGIVFAGSEPSTMRSLFTEVDQPFYAQADLVQIWPLTPPAVEEIVRTGWDGSPPPGLAAHITDFTSGHPQRVMQLADAAWSIAPAGADPPTDLWPLALERVRAATDAGHEVRFSTFRSAEQAVLRILATGGSIFGTAAALLDLSASSAQAARRRLVDRGILVERGRSFELVDPLFADWLARRFPT